MVKMVMDILAKNEAIRAILLECTELPPYADALRASTGLPVWDAITGADFYINAFKDNPRFGINDWQAEWDEEQQEYAFGMNLIESDQKDLVNRQSVGTTYQFKNKHRNSEAAAKLVKKL